MRRLGDSERREMPRNRVRPTKFTMSHSPDPRSRPRLNAYPGPAPVGCLPGQHIQVFTRPNGHSIIPFVTWSRHGSLAAEAHSNGRPQHLQSPTSSQQTQNPDSRGYSFILLSLIPRQCSDISPGQSPGMGLSSPSRPGRGLSCPLLPAVFS